MSRPPVRRAYHHGDLRRALIDSALALLAARPDAEIGLREVARATGVSATAVYRHFPDKDALCAALAATGFDRLADAQLAASVGHTTPLAAFRASGRAYVQFALANPALFRLMTARMNAAHMQGQDENRAARLLREQVAALSADAVPPERQRITVLQAWALAHGLAVLMLGGQIPQEPRLIEAVIDEFRAAPG
jgi:AcrR family transcriptional regulator